MKKVLSFLLAAQLILLTSGCSFYEDIGVSEIIEVVESEIENIIETVPTGEINYDEAFVYNTYYDSGYTALSDKQRVLYEDLYLIALDMTEGYIKLCYNYDGYYTDIGIAYNAMINDHPDFFWMPYTYIVAEAVDVNGSYISIAFEVDDGKNQNRYLVKREEREEMLEDFNAKIGYITAEAKKHSGEYEKVQFLNNYLCDNTEYDEFAELNQTSYGCLMNGKAICEGYSRAFKLLCNMVGIRCDLIYGMSENDNHMWNCVNISGNYSHVDVTWNDGNKENRYIFFNITDEQLLKDHSLYPHFSAVDDSSIDNGGIINFVDWKCDFEGNSYYSKNNLILNSENISKVAKKTEKAASNKETYIQFLIKDAEILKQLNNQNISAIKAIISELNEAEIKKYSLTRDVLTLYFNDTD